MLSSDDLFTGDYGAYVDETPNEIALNKIKEESVEFDLGEISHPNFGTAHIKGHFPRIRPRFSREMLTLDEIRSLHTELEPWVKIFFETTKNAQYFEEMIEAASTLAAYADPFHRIGSTEMKFQLRFYFWIWYTDDVMESAIARNVPFRLLEKGMSQLMAILRNEPIQYSEVFGCPGFRPVFNALANLHSQLVEHDPNYVKNSGALQFYLRRYFDGMRWYSVEHIDGAYSEVTFQFWRRLCAQFDTFAEVSFLLQGITLPEKILSCPALRRILDTCNHINAFTNDVLGIKKELTYNQSDNMVVFAVMEKKLPIEKAVSSLCDSIGSELTDFLLIRDAMLHDFNYDPNLVKYMDVIEALMDANNKLYINTRRHMAAGHVKLTG